MSQRYYTIRPEGDPTTIGELKEYVEMWGLKACYNLYQEDLFGYAYIDDLDMVWIMKNVGSMDPAQLGSQLLLSQFLGEIRRRGVPKGQASFYGGIGTVTGRTPPCTEHDIVDWGTGSGECRKCGIKLRQDRYLHWKEA